MIYNILSHSKQSLMLRGQVMTGSRSFIYGDPRH